MESEKNCKKQRMQLGNGAFYNKKSSLATLISFFALKPAKVPKPKANVAHNNPIIVFFFIRILLKKV